MKGLEAVQVGVVKAAASACMSTASEAVMGAWSVEEMIEKRKLMWWWWLSRMGNERLVKRVVSFGGEMCVSRSEEVVVE